MNPVSLRGMPACTCPHADRKSRSNLRFWDCHVAIASRNDSSIRALVNIYQKSYIVLKKIKNEGPDENIANRRIWTYSANQV